MRVLLTGGTGLIGSAVLAALLENGHDVLALVRNDDSAAKVRDAGAESIVGEIREVEWLQGVLNGVDGAIHLATDNSGPSMDDAVTDAVIGAFSGTDKPYLHTGGIWSWGKGENILETDPMSPPDITSWRVGPESRIEDSDVKWTIIVPGDVYGAKGAGLASLIGDGPHDENGALVLLGSGEQHWPVVSAADLAELYVAAIERSQGRTRYIGASGQNPTVREIGEAFVGPDGSVVEGSRAEAESRIGHPLAEALLLDQQAFGSKAKAELGWEPNSRPLIAEIVATRD